MKITYKEWSSKVHECLFYEDLRATLDGMEQGVIDKTFVDKLCKRNGHRFNWIDYSLEKNVDA